MANGEQEIVPAAGFGPNFLAQRDACLVGVTGLRVGPGKEKIYSAEMPRHPL